MIDGGGVEDGGSFISFRFEETWTRPSDDEKKPEGGENLNQKEENKWVTDQTRFWKAVESIQEHCGDTGREATILQDLRGGRIWVQINVWVRGQGSEESMLGHLIYQLKGVGYFRWAREHKENRQNFDMEEREEGETDQWNRQGWARGTGRPVETGYPKCASWCILSYPAVCVSLMLGYQCVGKTGEGRSIWG